MGAQHYPQYIDAALTAGTAVGNALDDWATSGQDTPTITWPTTGQEALFDGNGFSDPTAMQLWVPDEVMDDEDLYTMIGQQGWGRTPLDPEVGQGDGWAS